MTQEILNQTEPSRGDFSSPSSGRPVRMRLSRSRGFRLQEASRALNGLPCVKVDRSTRWGNPFSREVLESRGQHGCPTCQVVSFEHALTDQGRALIREHLAGKNLACWCPLDRMCHADIELGIANGHEPYLPAEVTAPGTNPEGPTP